MVGGNLEIYSSEITKNAYKLSTMVGENFGIYFSKMTKLSHHGILVFYEYGFPDFQNYPDWCQISKFSGAAPIAHFYFTPAVYQISPISNVNSTDFTPRSNSHLRIHRLTLST